MFFMYFNKLFFRYLKEEELDMLDEVYGKGLQGAGDGVQETPLGSPLVEVKDVVVVVNRSDIKSSGVLPSFLQSGGGGGGGKKGGVSSSIQSQDYPPGI